MKWKQFIIDNSCDVFIHSWANKLETNKIFQFLNPKILKIDQPKTFDVTHFKNRIWVPNTERLFSSFYSINKSLNLALEYDYDIIIRARFDWWFETCTLEQNDYVNIPDDPGLINHKFKFKNQNILGHNDQFGYGNKDVMRVYANTFNEIKSLYDDGVDYCDELFLTANLIKHNILVKYHNMNFKILRSE